MRLKCVKAGSPRESVISERGECRRFTKGDEAEWIARQADYQRGARSRAMVKQSQADVVVEAS